MCSLDVQLLQREAAQQQTAALMQREQEAMQRYDLMMREKLEHQSGTTQLQAKLDKVPRVAGTLIAWITDCPPPSFTPDACTAPALFGL